MGTSHKIREKKARLMFKLMEERLKLSLLMVERARVRRSETPIEILKLLPMTIFLKPSIIRKPCLALKTKTGKSMIKTEDRKISIFLKFNLNSFLKIKKTEKTETRAIMAEK